ncbi:MAG: ATP-binding protein, partial [Melioribacteraceae bacterium]
RNKTLGPIFKELQLIEQWGTGFQKLSDELKEYPEIELKINEPGLSFQIQFIKKDYQSEKGEDQVGTKLEPSWEQASPQVPSNHPASTPQAPRKYLESTPQAVKTLQFCVEYKFRQEIQDHLGLADREHFRKMILIPLIENLLLKMSSPEKPNSPNQKYIITEKGKLLLEELHK